MTNLSGQLKREEKAKETIDFSMKGSIFIIQKTTKSTLCLTLSFSPCTNILRVLWPFGCKVYIPYIVVQCVQSEGNEQSKMAQGSDDRLRGITTEVGCQLHQTTSILPWVNYIVTSPLFVNSSRETHKLLVAEQIIQV